MVHDKAESVHVSQSGEAMSLECQCRGELALRHRSCAEKWSRVKVGVRRHVLFWTRYTSPWVWLLCLLALLQDCHVAHRSGCFACWRCCTTVMWHTGFC